MKMDQEAILASATKILNEKGIQALSMRAIAASLNVKAGSLYFHIKNKEDLCEQISEGASKHVYDHLITLPNATINDLSNLFRQELKKVNDLPQIFATTAPFTPYRNKLINFTLVALRKQGVPEPYLTTVGNLINNYVLSFVSDEQYFARVDPAEFEKTVDSPINMADPDDSFEYGLNLIISGIQHAQTGSKPDPSATN